jgi:formylglycine-generating enzyme required for sulfatase activity
MKLKALMLLLAALTTGLTANAQLLKKLPRAVQKDLKNLKYISSGSYHLVTYNKTTFRLDTVTSLVQGFYLSAYEVTNDDWHMFHKSIVARDSKDEAMRYMPDTVAWIKAFPYSYNEPMVNMYFWHPGYANYPVVGITWNQAKEYCDWKSEQINKKLKEEGVTDFIIVLRMPTENEWMYVANPDYKTHNELLKSKSYKSNLVSYNGLIDKDGYQANFGPITDTLDYMFKSFIDDGAFHTANVNSYKPNVFGLYNIRGNVEEWVSDESTIPQTGGQYLQIMIPKTTEANTTLHSAKGGSWYDGPYYLSQKASKSYPANTCSPITGFRVAMDIVEVKPAAGK